MINAKECVDHWKAPEGFLKLLPTIFCFNLVVWILLELGAEVICNVFIWWAHISLLALLPDISR